MRGADPRTEGRSLLWDGVLAVGAAVALCFVLVLAFGGLDAGARTAPADARSIGQVERAVSEVRRRGDGTLVWSQLAPSAPLYDADAVFVGPDSEAVLALADGSRLEIEAGSLVILRLPAARARGPAAAPTVDVVRGGAMGTPGGAGLSLKTGAVATAVGDGSRVRVVVREDGSAQIDVASGTAVVGTPGGKSAVAAAQRQVVTATGETAGPVQHLALGLVAPAAGARLFTGGPRAEVRFRWASVAGAGPYRLELARDPGFRRPLAGATTEATEHVARDLPPGVYYWRARRATAAGEVVSEERRLTIVDDRAPLAYAPAAGVEVVQPARATITFAWTRVPDVTRYALEVARDDRFTQPSVQLEVNGLFHVLATQLPEGRNCFRVRSREAARADAPWSTPACFGVLHKPRLDAPEVFEPTVERGARRPRP